MFFAFICFRYFTAMFFGNPFGIQTSCGGLRVYAVCLYLLQIFYGGFLRRVLPKKWCFSPFWASDILRRVSSERGPCVLPLFHAGMPVFASDILRRVSSDGEPTLLPPVSRLYPCGAIVLNFSIASGERGRCSWEFHKCGTVLNR